MDETKERNLQGLSDLYPAIKDYDDLVNYSKLDYTHLKHGKGKVIVSVTRQEQTFKLIMSEKDSEKALKFIQDLKMEHKKRQRRKKKKRRRRKYEKNKRG